VPTVNCSSFRELGQNREREISIKIQIKLAISQIIYIFTNIEAMNAENDTRKEYTL